MTLGPEQSEADMKALLAALEAEAGNDRVGWEYVHSFVDDCSRLAYAEIHEDERAPTVTGFTRRAFEWFEGRGIGVERLMTDNHFSYTKSTSLAEFRDRRAVSHLLIRPYTPRTNGKVERFHQTLMREWAYALEYASSDAGREALPHWLLHYNERRSHSALGHRPPIARVRDVSGFDIQSSPSRQSGCRRESLSNTLAPTRVYAPTCRRGTIALSAWGCSCRKSRRSLE